MLNITFKHAILSEVNNTLNYKDNKPSFFYYLK